MKTLYLSERDDLSDALRQNRTSTRFVLPAGNWELPDHSAWMDLDCCMLGPNCELIGAGSNQTTLYSLYAGNNASQSECLTAGSRSDYCPFIRVEGVAIRCSPGWDVGMVGLHIWSDRAIVRDVLVHGVRGTLQASGEPSMEGFGILLNESGISMEVGGSIVEDVRVIVLETAPKRPDFIYANGVYVGYRYPVQYSSVRNAAVHNLSETPCHTAFGINGMVLGSGWSNTGRFNRAIYSDVTGGRNTLVTDSILSAERVIMDLKAGAGESWDNIVLSNSTLLLRPVESYGAVLTLSELAASEGFRNVQVANCLIDCGDTKLPVWAGSLKASRASGCGLRGCITQAKVMPVSVSEPAGAFTVS